MRIKPPFYVYRLRYGVGLFVCRNSHEDRTMVFSWRTMREAAEALKKHKAAPSGRE